MEKGAWAVFVFLIWQNVYAFVNTSVRLYFIAWYEFLSDAIEDYKILSWMNNLDNQLVMFRVLIESVQIGTHITSFAGVYGIHNCLSNKINAKIKKEAIETS